MAFGCTPAEEAHVEISRARLARPRVTSWRRHCRQGEMAGASPDKSFSRSTAAAEIPVLFASTRRRVEWGGGPAIRGRRYTNAPDS